MTREATQTSSGDTGRILLPWLISASLLIAVITAVTYSQNNLGRPALWSGYSLLAVVAALSLFHVRKRLPMIPLGHAHLWQKTHIAFGVLSIALYAIHVDGWWPPGIYERWLASSFYLAVGSGILGYCLQLLIPARLAETQDEIIVERIADVVAELRDEARECVERSLSETQSNTITRFYVETFDTFFQRPRFLTNHLMGGRLAEHWLNNQFVALARYCDKQEMVFVEELRGLAATKARVDSHYARMSLLKLWLFIHIPAVVGLLALICWHWLLINIYAL